MVYLTDTFSLDMLPTLPCFLKVQRLSVGQVREMLPQARSMVGRLQMAALYSEVLGEEIQRRRDEPKPWLLVGDRVVVGEYRGPRLPEGAMELPKDASIHWQSVEVC